jgi:hypothetical protein
VGEWWDAAVFVEWAVSRKVMQNERDEGGRLDGTNEDGGGTETRDSPNKDAQLGICLWLVEEQVKCVGLVDKTSSDEMSDLES